MSLYDANFYDRINGGSLRSAEVVVPILMEHRAPAPKTVFDFGCGEGAWLRVFKDYGCEVMGFDGAYVDKSRLLIEQHEFTPMNLDSLTIHDNMNVDLVISLEVAEHLRPSSAESFIKSLCKVAPWVVFSAAIPGQGGNGHINCQWASYWVDLFAKHGFTVNDSLRWEIWNSHQVEPWYKQNILEFRKDYTFGPYFKGDVVHPEIWAWK